MLTGRFGYLFVDPAPLLIVSLVYLHNYEYQWTAGNTGFSAKTKYRLEHKTFGSLKSFTNDFYCATSPIARPTRARGSLPNRSEIPSVV